MNHVQAKCITTTLNNGHNQKEPHFVWLLIRKETKVMLIFNSIQMSILKNKDIFMYLEMYNCVFDGGTNSRVSLLKYYQSHFCVTYMISDNNNSYECNMINNKKWNGLVRTVSKGGTILAMFLTTKASPGWKFKMWDGQTRESEQANTRNCIIIKESTSFSNSSSL